MGATQALAAEIVDALLEVLETDPARAKRFVSVVTAANAPTEPVTPTLLTKQRTAAALNISVAKLDRAVTQGCPCEYAGASRRFDLDAVRAWFKARGKLPTKPRAKHAPENDPINVDRAAQAAGFRPNSH